MSNRSRFGNALRPALGVAVVAALSMLALHAAIRLGLRAPRTRCLTNPSILGLEFREFRLPTANRKLLKAWLIPTASSQPAPTLIVMHGWGSNSEMMLPLAKPLHDAGYALLFVDARNHGDSEDDDFSSLPRFAEDIESALIWIVQQPGTDRHRIGLIGHSVGAAAALLVASRRNDVGAVISLSAFAHPEGIMRRFLSDHSVPFVPFGWYTLNYVQRVIGQRFDDIAPRNTIRAVSCPVLLAHGKSDATVPSEDAEEIHAQSRQDSTRLLLVDGDHEKYTDPQKSIRAILEFLAEAMKRTATACTQDQSGAAMPSSKVLISPD